MGGLATPLWSSLAALPSPGRVARGLREIRRELDAASASTAQSSAKERGVAAARAAFEEEAPRVSSSLYLSAGAVAAASMAESG